MRRAATTREVEQPVAVRKDRKLRSSCSSCGVVDCRAIPIQPIEQLVGERGEAVAVDIPQDASGTGDIQRRTYLPQSRAEWLDLSRVGDEEAVDQQLEHEASSSDCRPHDLGRWGDHAIAARDDRDVADTIDVRNLARKAIECLEDLAQVIEGERAAARVERLGDAGRLEVLDDMPGRQKADLVRRVDVVRV